MYRFNLIRGLALSMAVLMCAPAVNAGKSGSRSSSSSSRSSSRSSSGGGFFSSKPKPAPAPAQKPAAPPKAAPAASSPSRNAAPAGATFGKAPVAAPAASQSAPVAKSAPSTGLSTRNANNATGIGNGKIAAKAVSTPAAKLSAADQKMVEAMKKSGVKTTSREEAKVALLKKDPSLASPQAVSSKFNTFTSKPTAPPSYMPENTSYNGTTYVRVLYQDPISGSYSYRYRDPLGSMIDAYMIASIADSMTDYAMARQGIYYPNSYYAPPVVVHRSSGGAFALIFLFLVAGVVVVAVVASSRKSNY